jgi:hypothetical protein
MGVKIEWNLRSKRKMGSKEWASMGGIYGLCFTRTHMRHTLGRALYANKMVSTHVMEL